MKKCVALIIPYKWYEDFSMIIAESFSSECPILVTDIGNTRDIVVESKDGVI